MISEQLKQNEIYSESTYILDKYECLNLGATTLGNLIDNKYIKNFSITPSQRKKKPDVLVIDSDKNIVIYIENKISNKFKTENDINKAILQHIDVARAVKALIYVVSDGDSFIWINPITGNPIRDENDNIVNVQIRPKENDKKIASLIHNVLLSINKDNDQILKKSYSDPTDLAKKINRILVNMTFASAKMSLYTFVELFLFKYLSDIGILKNRDSFQHIAKMYTEEYQKMHSECSNAMILGEYLENGRETMSKLFPEAIDGTSIINGKVFHSSKNDFNQYISEDNTDLIFKEIILEFEKYEKENGKFIYISKDFKSKLFETFMKNSQDKSDMGQFFTPLKIVREMIRMVDIHEGMKICDPACGVGKFLLGSIEDKIHEFYEFSHKVTKVKSKDNMELTKKIEIVGLDKMMSEKDDITIILAKANMLIHFSDFFQGKTLPEVNFLAQKLLNETFLLSKKALGSLEKIEKNSYDLILANPPYYQSKVISDEAKKTKQYTLNASGVEGLFLEWILKSLSSGGIANIVLPDGIFANNSSNTIKKYILDNFFIEAIISLPVNSFFNTPKKTYILTVKKKTTDERDNNKQQDYDVFSYISMSIGETLDNYRFDIDDNDLKEAVNKYNFYRKNKSEMPEFLEDHFSLDKKLKLIPISEFQHNKSWIIENWWSEQEKIELGLNKRKTEVTIDEFYDLVNDIILDLNNFKEEIKCLV